MAGGVLALWMTACGVLWLGAWLEGAVIVTMGGTMITSGGRVGATSSSTGGFCAAGCSNSAAVVSSKREVAAMMSDAEIATAQREARAWMTAH